jgi:hypothetical protein
VSCLFASRLAVAHHQALFRYIPVGVYVIAWLKQKVHFGNSCAHIGKSVIALIQNIKKRSPRFIPGRHSFGHDKSQHSIENCEMNAMEPAGHTLL